jgi:hypothetical protein
LPLGHLAAQVVVGLLEGGRALGNALFESSVCLLKRRLGSPRLPIESGIIEGERRTAGEVFSQGQVRAL